MELSVILIAVLALAFSVGAAVGVLALARELGQVLVRIGPDSALPTAEGFDIGDEIPDLVLTARGGAPAVITSEKRPYVLLLFVAPNCPACISLLPAVSVLARSYRDLLSIFLIGNELLGDSEARSFASDDNVSFASSPSAFRTMRVAGTPFAMLLDSEKRVLSRGTPNSLAHLESLISERHVELRSASTPRY